VRQVAFLTGLIVVGSRGQAGSDSDLLERTFEVRQHGVVRDPKYPQSSRGQDVIAGLIVVLLILVDTPSTSMTSLAAWQ
jgi:hypothetical protein